MLEGSPWLPCHSMWLNGPFLHPWREDWVTQSRSFHTVAALQYYWPSEYVRQKYNLCSLTTLVVTVCQTQITIHLLLIVPADMSVLRLLKSTSTKINWPNDARLRLNDKVFFLCSTASVEDLKYAPIQFRWISTTLFGALQKMHFSRRYIKNDKYVKICGIIYTVVWPKVMSRG